MQAIGYYLSLPFLYFISVLPFPILYALSDFLYIVVYYVFGYRKTVVKANLKNSFPEKSEAELLKIEKEFYHYIIDFFLEMLKCLTISKKELLKRVSSENRELLEELHYKGENIIGTTGHYGNHEWINQALPFITPFKIKTVYRTQHNPFFDKLFFDFRSRFGTIMVSMKESFNEIKKEETSPFAFILANDQSAPPAKAYWTTFLNQETSFYTGTEFFARKFDMPVVYFCIKRVSRGKYHVVFELITETPNALLQGEILESHANKLERDIKADPGVWMWSHKRWKYKNVEGEYLDVNYRK